MRFLVDNQLPPALARFIGNDLGAEADHVADLGFKELRDRQLWHYAAKEGYILISKDEDFVSLFQAEPVTGLLWVRIGNCRRMHLLNAFERAWTAINECFARGDRFVELR